MDELDSSFNAQALKSLSSVLQDKVDLPSAPAAIETTTVSNVASHLPSQADMVDIGHRVQISNSAWLRIKQLPKDSLFVKELLVAIWGTAALRNHSHQGRHCPKFPDRPRKTALSPAKLAVMRGENGLLFSAVFDLFFALAAMVVSVIRPQTC
ncbi:hypothetical protein V5799_014176 [Amblyomma americanum]|uniref:BEN domain-containing protein n=1 Tax=Amblyomma americanum TaxID=6943 RepID=A0AAQ4E3T3_AMBAM